MSLHESSVGGPLTAEEWSTVEGICERAMIRGSIPEDVDDALDLLPRIFCEDRKAKAERDAARALLGEIIDRIDRIEHYEELRGMTRTFRDAVALHMRGANDAAVDLLRADMQEDEP